MYTKAVVNITLAMCLLIFCVYITLAADVAKLKEAFTRRRQTWSEIRTLTCKWNCGMCVCVCRDDSGSLLDNLKRVLCVEFPAQPKTPTELVCL